MKVILYMAMTVNGMIARENDRTGWSIEEWNSYHNAVNKIGNIIIGRRTFEIMKKHNEFERIENPFTVVVTNNKMLSNDNFAFVSSPQDALNLLKKKGFNIAIVAGGSKLNTSFMKEGLIDEIYLDIEPKVFGKGIKLFSDEDFEIDLELIDIKKFSTNGIQIHYKVKKL